MRHPQTTLSTLVRGAVAHYVIVPPRVRVRIALLLLASGLVTVAPWLLLRSSIAIVFQVVLVLGGLYIGWCLWPRWTWGIGQDIRGTLPTTDGQAVRLSFDDGPTPGFTDRVLDLLQQHRVRAAFFVLVPKARANPGLIQRILQDGHVLGLHGADHRSPFFRSVADLHASLAQARAELQAIAGQEVRLYRPSHGWKTLGLLLAVRRAGLRFTFWDYGPWDTDVPPVPVLVHRLSTASAAQVPRCPVVLVHDGLGDDPGIPRHGEALLPALARWLPEIRGPAPG